MKQNAMTMGRRPAVRRENLQGKKGNKKVLWEGSILRMH